jgi:hypothetical protein
MLKLTPSDQYKRVVGVGALLALAEIRSVVTSFSRPSVVAKQSMNAIGAPEIVLA